MKRMVTILPASFAVCALPLAAQSAAKLPAQGKALVFRAGLFGSGEASLGSHCIGCVKNPPPCAVLFSKAAGPAIIQISLREIRSRLPSASGGRCCRPL